MARNQQFDRLVDAIAAQAEVLSRVERAPSLQRHGVFRWTVGRPVVKTGLSQERMQRMPLELTITNLEKCQVTATPEVSPGVPALVDGPVLFDVIGGDCTIEAIDDLNAFIVSGSLLADSLVQVTADADLGAGVVTIQDAVTVHVLGAMATSLGLSAGVPIRK